MKNLYDINDWSDVSYLRLGEILLESGKINLYHLSMVLDIQRFQKLPVGKILLLMKVVSEEDIRQALYIQNIIRKRCSNA